MKRLFLAVVFFAVASAGGVLANENPGFREPTFTGPLSASEKAFVAEAQAALASRFASASDAEKAGFVRYTSEDESGAISYANRQWQSSDANHPSQLWYDKHGQLLGADFSRLKSADTPPNLWGINPGRWFEFDRHMHFVTRKPDGTIVYDQYVADDDWLAAGGSLQDPSPATLVKLGKVTSASEVVTLFNFPAVWDLIIWIKPNPDGAFAYKNPLVTP
jgi:hypothetical protein